MIGRDVLAVLDGLPPGSLPIDPRGPAVTERPIAPAAVRVERFDWDGQADVVALGPAALVVVTECAPACVQSIVPLVRTADGWVEGPPAPDLDPDVVERLYRDLTGDLDCGFDAVPVMVEVQPDGRLLVVTQAHLGVVPATIGELALAGEGGLRFVPAVTA